MSNTLVHSPLIWLDLEYTDFDVHKGKIVEIATVLTDENLKIIDHGPNLVIHQPEEILSGMVKWNKEHFDKNGLLEDIRKSTVTEQMAEAETLSFLKKYCTPESSPLAGSSVYIDRDYLSDHMPSLFAFLHYRVIDTNTIKELMHRWYPHVPDYPKVEPHRAKADVLECIDELKYYQENIFK